MDFDERERRYQQRKFARVTSPQGKVNEVVVGSEAYAIVVALGWQVEEIEQPEEEQTWNAPAVTKT